MREPCLNLPSLSLVSIACDPGEIDTALAAAVDDERWHSAVWRLNGVAASFGAVDLMAAVTDAAGKGVGDAVALGRLRVPGALL